MYPTKYKGKETDDLYIEMSRKGYTDIEIASKMEVTVQSFYNWEDKYPSFKYARAVGKQLCEAWYINFCRGKMIGAEEVERGDTQMAKWIMMNKFGWGDNSKQKVSIEQMPKLVVEFVDAESNNNINQ